MAEAVAVVGAVAACSQLAKYGTGLAKFILNSPSELQVIPEIIEETFERLNWHLGIVRSLNTNGSNPVGEPSIQPIVRASIRAASSLQQLLTPLIVYGKQTKVKKLKRILSYQRRIRKIDRCRTDLECCERQLMLHLAATTYCNTYHFTNYNRTTEAMHHASPPPVAQPSRTSTFSTLRTSMLPRSGSFNIPSRSKLIGRDSVICSLSHILIVTGQKACLVGLGGIGKSAVATECAYRIHDLHPSISIFWVQASDHLMFQQSLVQILRHLEIHESVDSRELSLLTFVETLDSAWTNQWLLIVDDIHGSLDRYSAVERLSSLPIKHGSILFTTRDAYTATSLVDARLVFGLNPMTTDEAADLLAYQMSSDALLDTGTHKLVAYLDCHPRAITKAAESMKAHGISAAQYLRMLEQKEEQWALLGNTDFTYRSSLGEVTRTLSDIICMEELWDQDEDATHFLAMMACLSHEKTPLSLFNAVYGPKRLTHIFDTLIAFSLINLLEADGTVVVPRLVRMSVRAHLRQHQIASTYAFHALRIIARGFPGDAKHYATISECKLYLPHALAVIKEYAKIHPASHMARPRHNNLSSPERDREQPYLDILSRYRFSEAEPMILLDYVGPLAFRVSHFLRVIGKYSRAMEIATQASKWFSGASPMEALSCEASITSLLHYLGHPMLFASQMEQIYLSQTILLRSHRPLTICVMRSKGLALQAQGHYAQAEGYHRRAIAICRSTYGPQDTRLLDEEHGLALSILGQERPQEALDILCTIYNSMEAFFSLKNPKMLSVLANIGCALQQLSRWTDAYHALSCALSGRREVLGEDHPHTIQSRANLAQIHVANGDYATAESLTRETLQLHVVTLGEDHHLSLHMMNNLGYILLGQERFAEAAETLHRVARRREATLGPEHCDTLDSLFYASEAYWKMKSFDDALQLGGKVLQAREGLDDDDAGREAIERRMREIDRDRRLVR